MWWISNDCIWRHIFVPGCSSGSDLSAEHSATQTPHSPHKQTNGPCTQQQHGCCWRQFAAILTCVCVCVSVHWVRDRRVSMSHSTIFTRPVCFCQRSSHLRRMEFTWVNVCIYIYFLTYRAKTVVALIHRFFFNVFLFLDTRTKFYHGSQTLCWPAVINKLLNYECKNKNAC